MLSLLAATLTALDVNVQLPATRANAPLNGRMLILFSTDPSAEPRFQITDTPKTQVVFGADIDQLRPGASHTISEGAYGYPIQRLSSLKPGEYTVQALFDLYETFHRADGHTVLLPTDRGEGRQWNRAPGNLYSKPIKITVNSGTAMKLQLTEVIPQITPPKDTLYIKHLRIQSALLTKFWGKPVFLGANILLPHGFDQHADE